MCKIRVAGHCASKSGRHKHGMRGMELASDGFGCSIVCGSGCTACVASVVFVPQQEAAGSAVDNAAPAVDVLCVAGPLLACHLVSALH